MRVLLTGGSGFLGSRVLPLLKEHDVLCLSRDPGRFARRDGVTAIAADLGKAGDWIGDIAKFQPEWCIHLAWEALPDYSLERCRANLDASLLLLDAVAQPGFRRMVVAGSCWEYGRASGAVSEDRVPVDLNVFAATKHALLTVLDSVARDRGFEYRWARVFFVYGPGQRPTSLIPHLHAAYAAGRAPDVRRPDVLQDFVHVDDAGAALVALVTCDAPSGIFNVGSGRPASVGRVANRAADHYRTKRPFECPCEGQGFWADTSKMYAATGWRARIGLDEGIEATLAALDGMK